MEELAKFLSTNWGTLKFLAGLVALPLIYLKDCADVFKEVREWHQNQKQRIGDVQKGQLRNELYVFQLQWWLIASITAVLIGVFFLGDIVNYTELLSEGKNKDLAKGILNGYGLLLPLLAIFYVRWRKTIVYRKLTAFDDVI